MNKFTRSDIRLDNFIIFKQFGVGAGIVGQIKAGDFGRFNNAEYHPIPLTREWILKLGFKQLANGAYHLEPMYTWRLWYDDFEKAAQYCTDVYSELTHAVYLPIRIEFVHELQNVFYFMTLKELPYQSDQLG